MCPGDESGIPAFAFMGNSSRLWGIPTLTLEIFLERFPIPQIRSIVCKTCGAARLLKMDMRRISRLAGRLASYTANSMRMVQKRTPSVLNEIG
jgi:hypothetical protein